MEKKRKKGSSLRDIPALHRRIQRNDRGASTLRNFPSSFVPFLSKNHECLTIDDDRKEQTRFPRVCPIPRNGRVRCSLTNGLHDSAESF